MESCKILLSSVTINIKPSFSTSLPLAKEYISKQITTSKSYECLHIAKIYLRTSYKQVGLALKKG